MGLALCRNTWIMNESIHTYLLVLNRLKNQGFLVTVLLRMDEFYQKSRLITEWLDLWELN